MPSKSYTVGNVTGTIQIIDVHASNKIKSKVYASVWKATSIVPGLGETLWIGSGYFLSAGLALLGRTFKIYIVYLDNGYFLETYLINFVSQIAKCYFDILL